MSVNAVSPALASLIKKTEVQKNVEPKIVQIPTTEQTKPDSFIKNGVEKFKSLDNKKKFAIIAGTIAAACALVFALTKGKIMIKAKGRRILNNGNKIAQQGQEIQKKGAEVLTESQKKLDEVMTLIQQGEQKGFNDIVEGTKTIKFSGEESKIMSEFNGEALMRKTEFTGAGKDITVSSIEEFIGGTNKSNQFVYENNILNSYNKGLEQLADKLKAQEQFTFYENGKVVGYNKGLEQLADKLKTQEQFTFYENGKVAGYNKGIEVSGVGLDISSKVQNSFVFLEDGKVAGYSKGTEVSAADNSVKVQEALSFKDGKLNEYRKGDEKI